VNVLKLKFQEQLLMENRRLEEENSQLGGLLQGTERITTFLPLPFHFGLFFFNKKTGVLLTFFSSLLDIAGGADGEQTTERPEPVKIALPENAEKVERAGEEESKKENQMDVLPSNLQVGLVC
jgi:hypothetical protein